MNQYEIEKLIEEENTLLKEITDLIKGKNTATVKLVLNRIDSSLMDISFIKSNFYLLNEKKSAVH